MRILLAAFLLIPGSAGLVAQTPANAQAAQPAPIPTGGPATGAAPAPTAPPRVEDSDIGFSYGLPADWQELPIAQKLDLPYPTAVAPTKGDACIKVAMTARHGAPASVVVVLALAFNCYGQIMTAGDLEGFGSGAAAGFKQSFAILNQAQGNYALGNHTMWIERADGTPKDRPENPNTFEIACTVLEKGAVCWMTIAADAASLRDFEQQAVTLEGQRFNALVPSGAAPVVPATAAKKPS